MIEKLAGENDDNGMAATLASIAVSALELLVGRASGDMLGDGIFSVVSPRKADITVDDSDVAPKDAEIDALVLLPVGRGVGGALAAGEGAEPTWDGGTTFTATAAALAMGRGVCEALPAAVADATAATCGRTIDRRAFAVLIVLA